MAWVACMEESCALPAQFIIHKYEYKDKYKHNYKYKHNNKSESGQMHGPRSAVWRKVVLPSAMCFASNAIHSIPLKCIGLH